MNPLQLARQAQEAAAAKAVAASKQAAADAAALALKNEKLKQAQAGIAAAAAAAGVANPLAGLTEKLQGFIDANSGKCTPDLVDPLIGDGVLIESANVQYGGIGYTDYVYVDTSNPSELHVLNQKWLWRIAVGLLLLVSGLHATHSTLE
jgi:hypothetical protein